MTEIRTEQLGDPWAVSSAEELLTLVPERTRSISLPVADPRPLAQAIAGMANGRGGVVIVGIEPDGGNPAGRAAAIDPAAFEQGIAAAVELIDPPVSHLVLQRTLPVDGGVIGLVHVRLSPSAPHMVTADGRIYRINAEGAQPIRSRRALDELYARGRGERERADRLVDAMMEKLSLQHYAFYSLAVIGCTHVPSGEPYRSARTDRAWLTPASDELVARFNLAAVEPRVGPGEVEVRSPGDVNAFMIVTRNGCVAAGEVQRRPYHEEMDSQASLTERLRLLVHTVGRMLSAAPDTIMLPHVFIEGIRGLRIVRDTEKRMLSGNAPQDTARHPLTAGDARDVAYLQSLPDEAMDRLATLFP